MKKIFLLMLAVAGTIMQTKAQVQINGELKTLINQSFSYFPNLKESQNAITAAEQNLDLTKMNNLPTVGGDASYAYVQPKIVLPFPLGPGGAIENFQFAAVNNYGGSVSGSYMLLDFGRLKANVEKA
ncbi:MAG TPA: TolC family protein, partial [Puia sp.]|nr:TolC family protein [Puia sp.]